ncbi:NifU family protein [Azomonas macrocytogenes]|uniref:NifU-like protein n=1 Tax=Azomonas macrocytogenes TaxID=69962 RepID=A0A839T1R1_AZOMA|nr:NifU family protein [Azomonas macrocytogenes]MBB3103038.1 NifU-like protein [Azomonas macrocytogenes]
MSNLPVYTEADDSEEIDQGLNLGESIPEEALPLIRDTIEKLRPGVRRDGGDIELVELQGNVVRVKLSGACVGCAMSAQTLGGVRRHLVQALNNPAVRVLPAI